MERHHGVTIPILKIGYERIRAALKKYGMQWEYVNGQLSIYLVKNIDELDELRAERCNCHSSSVLKKSEISTIL